MGIVEGSLRFNTFIANDYFVVTAAHMIIKNFEFETSLAHKNQANAHDTRLTLISCKRIRSVHSPPKTRAQSDSQQRDQQHTLRTL